MFTNINNGLEEVVEVSCRISYQYREMYILTIHPYSTTYPPVTPPPTQTHTQSAVDNLLHKSSTIIRLYNC